VVASIVDGFEWKEFKSIKRNLEVGGLKTWSII
jgi:hypothetical protein